MAYKCTFMDNAEYTASDVNNMMSVLASEGVPVFNDTGNLPADLNAAVAAVATEGVAPKEDGCLVVLRDGEYYISDGNCIMPDGSMICFTDGGEKINRIEDVNTYVYLRRNYVGNTIDIIVSEQSCSEGDVPLAMIYGEGSIVDQRIFSESKTIVSTENISATNAINYTLYGNGTLNIDMGFAGFKYIIYKNKLSLYQAEDLSDGEYHDIICGLNSSYLGRVKKEGNKVVFANQLNWSGSCAWSLSFEVR